MAYVSPIFSVELDSFTTTVGNYTNTVVRDNVIYGGFASDNQDASNQTKGDNSEDAIIKLVVG